MAIDTDEIKKRIFNLYDDLYFLIRILEFSDKTKNIDYYDDQVSMLDLNTDFPELMIANEYQDVVCNSDSYEHFDRVIKISYSFITFAESKNKKGLIDDALKYLRYAEFFTGLAREIDNSIEFQKSKNRRSEISQMGGKAKSARYQPLKDYVAKLLVSHKPVNGWNSKAEAVRCLQNDVSAFNEELGRLYIEDAQDGMKNSITRWLTDDLKLKSIIENNLSPKARERYERRNRLK